MYCRIKKHDFHKTSRLTDITYRLRVALRSNQQYSASEEQRCLYWSATTTGV